LMHRFLVSHENLQRETDEHLASEGNVAHLVATLRALRKAAPANLEVAPAAERRLRLHRSQAAIRHYDSQHLAGFWNRYPMLVLRVGSLYALAEGDFTVDVKHLEPAEALLQTKLYPVLGALVDEMAASREKKRLLDVADDLLAAGPEGWDFPTLYKKTNALSPRSQADSLAALIAQGLVFQHQKRLYGKKAWRDEQVARDAAED